MNLKKIILMIIPRIIILVLLLFWVGIFKSLILYGESHLFEPNKAIAIIELSLACFGSGWFVIKSFNEIKQEGKE